MICVALLHRSVCKPHYSDVIMSAMASQITGVSIVCSTFRSGPDQREHQSSASLAFVRGIHRQPHKGPVTQEMFQFDDVIMSRRLFFTQIWHMQQQKEWYMMILKIDLEWHIHTVSFRWKYGNLCTRACLSHNLLKGDVIRLINLFRWECWRLPQGSLRHSGAERWWGWLFCCFAVTVCTCRWHSDNFRCGQWWLSSIKPGSASMNISDDNNHLGTFYFLSWYISLMSKALIGIDLRTCFTSFTSHLLPHENGPYWQPASICHMIGVRCCLQLPCDWQS